MIKKSPAGRSERRHQIPVEEIKTWADFQRVVADYPNWAFRGHGDAEWPLYSSLSRYLQNYKIHTDNWADQEERIVRIFKRKAHLYLDQVPNEQDAFQWLALMQHHGAPTRLVDFTWSPFVAAFFALERASKDAAIWAVFVPAMWRKDHEIRFPDETIASANLHLREPGAYERFFLRNTVPFVKSGEPFVMNRRLIAQSGTFVVPGVLDQPIDQILASYPESRSPVAKFVLRTSAMRDEAMRALYIMNVTNSTLFPDLDGLARSTAYELEYHWGYNPKEPRRQHEE